MNSPIKIGITCWTCSWIMKKLCSKSMRFFSLTGLSLMLELALVSRWLNQVAIKYMEITHCGLLAEEIQKPPALSAILSIQMPSRCKTRTSWTTFCHMLTHTKTTWFALPISSRPPNCQTSLVQISVLNKCRIEQVVAKLILMVCQLEPTLLQIITAGKLCNSK